MYDDRCKGCEHYGHCMHMMTMPMMNMPMMNMPMEDEDDDEDLKKMYPKIYIRLYPMVRHHCDMMESMHGAMYCPSKEEMDCICKEICDKYEEHHDDDDDDDDDHDHHDHHDHDHDHHECRNVDVDDDDMRQRRRRGRRRLTQDLIRILLLRNLLGRRRRRRRRPHGY